MEDFMKDWGRFYEKATGRTALLEQCLSEIKESKSSDATQGVVKDYLEAVIEVIKPLIGAPYKGYSHIFEDKANSIRGYIRTDGYNRIRQIELGFRNYPAYYADSFLVCEEKKGVFRYYFRGKPKEKKKVDEFVSELLGCNYSEVNKTLSSINTMLKSLVDFLPKPFMDKIESLEKSLKEEREEEKKLFSFSERVLEVEEKLREKRAEMKKHGLYSDGFTLSVDDVLEMGVAPKMEISKLYGPVVGLFDVRDQRVPKIIDELREKNVESFHALLKALEARARSELSDLHSLPFSEIQRELSYFKNCGLPVEEYKKLIISSVRKKEKSRKKKVDKLLEGLKEI